VTLGTLVHLANMTGDEVRDLRGRGATSTPAPRRQLVEPKPPAPAATPASGDGFASIEELVAWAETRYGVKLAGSWRYGDEWHQLRFDTDNGKQFRPATRDADGRWHLKAPPARHLYRVEHLPADAGELVLVVEGEKCADIGAALGFATVTSCNGSESAAKSDWTPLRGRRVAILPDNDAPGRKYACEVLAILQGLGCDAVVVELPGLSDGEDIEQWAAGRGDAAGDELVELIEDAGTGKWQWPDAGEQQDALMNWCKSLQGREYVGMACGVFPTIDKMLDGWRGLALLSGAPGCGKTTMVLQTAIGVLHKNPDALVVLLSCEMSPRELHGRLLTMHAPEETPLNWHQLVKGQGIDPADRRLALGCAVTSLEPVLPRLKVLGLGDVLRLRDAGNGDLFVPLRVELRRLMRRSRCRQAMIVIDNFATLPVLPAGESPWGNDLDRDRQVSESLRLFQDQTDAALLTIVQLSKGAMQQRGRQSEEQRIADSSKGAVEQTYNADIVARLRKVRLQVPRQFDRFGEPLPVVQMRVNKGRDGATRGKALLLFDYEKHRLHEVDRDGTVKMEEGCDDDE
jgi:replicative DNA helicase